MNIRMKPYFTLDQNAWPQRYRYLTAIDIHACDCGTAFEMVREWREPKPQLGGWLRWLPIVYQKQE